MFDQGIGAGLLFWLHPNLTSEAVVNSVRTGSNFGPTDTQLEES